MLEYLIFGAGFYIGMCAKDPSGFIDADLASIIRGLLIGLVFWPIGLTVQIIFAIIDFRGKK